MDATVKREESVIDDTNKERKQAKEEDGNNKLTTSSTNRFHTAATVFKDITITNNTNSLGNTNDTETSRLYKVD